MFIDTQLLDWLDAAASAFPELRQCGSGSFRHLGGERRRAERAGTRL